MKRILVATDFSENAMHAAQFAAKCFAAESVNYHLVYVSNCHNNPKKKPSPVPCKGTTCSANRIKLQQFQNKFSKHLNPKLHRCDSYFVDLPPVEALRKQIQEHDIDLIVIGCCGQKKAKQLGRFAQDVIIRVQSPFLIIPPNASLEPLKVMAFATNYNNNYHSSVLNTLTDFVAVNDLKLNVLQYSKSNQVLNEIQSANREFLSEFVEDSEAFYELKGAPLDAALADYQQNHPIGILSLLAKNRSFCEQLLFKATRTGKCSLFDRKLPVLLLHE